MKAGGTRGCTNHLQVSTGVFWDIWLVFNVCVPMKGGQCSYCIKHDLLCLYILFC